MGMTGKLNTVFWRATLRRGRTRQSASLQWETFVQPVRRSLGVGGYSKIPAFHYPSCYLSVYSHSAGGRPTSYPIANVSNPGRMSIERILPPILNSLFASKVGKWRRRESPAIVSPGI